MIWFTILKPIPVPSHSDPIVLADIYNEYLEVATTYKKTRIRKKLKFKDKIPVKGIKEGKGEEEVISDPERLMAFTSKIYDAYTNKKLSERDFKKYSAQGSAMLINTFKEVFNRSKNQRQLRQNLDKIGASLYTSDLVLDLDVIVDTYMKADPEKAKRIKHKSIVHLFANIDGQTEFLNNLNDDLNETKQKAFVKDTAANAARIKDAMYTAVLADLGIEKTEAFQRKYVDTYGRKVTLVKAIINNEEYIADIKFAGEE